MAEAVVGVNGHGPAPDGGRETDPNYPAPLDDAAYHGIAGEIVRALAPHTEAAPEALLVTLLAIVGNIIGDRAYFVVSGTQHTPRVYPVLVGPTSLGAKGTSWDTLAPVVERAMPDWFARCVVEAGGLASGEGLIWAVRDPIERKEALREGGKKTGKVEGYQTIVEDPGVEDKRLFVLEDEFGVVLQVIKRETNTLAGIVRKAWDGKNLRSMVKTNPARATKPLISILGHITPEELLKLLDDTQIANGFGNRFLFVAVRDSQDLPGGGNLAEGTIERLGDELRDYLKWARQLGRLARDEETEAIWGEVYGPLKRVPPGLLGAVMARGRPQVMRLASVYAALDVSGTIRRAHLEAALALWQYSAASVRHVFGDTFGDQLADTILLALNGGNLTDTEIFDLFGRNESKAKIKLALGQLVRAGLIASEQAPAEGRGRPPTIWSRV